MVSMQGHTITQMGGSVLRIGAHLSGVAQNDHAIASVTQGF